MKCHGCGHSLTDNSSRCPRCHRSVTRRARHSKDARLLEFPKRARNIAPSVATAPSLPPWRLELNEKVRAIRARRAADSEAEMILESPAASIQTSIPAAFSPVTDEIRITHSVQSGASAVAPRRETSSAMDSAAMPVRRSNIVEAALTRVRRASENASRAALPKIEPVRPVQTAPPISLPVDREATARALEPISEPEPPAEALAAPEIIPEAITRPINAEPIRVETVEKEVMTSAEPAATSIAEAVAKPIPEPIASSVVVIDDAPITKLSAIDELEPIDYLEAEIRKVDKALGSQFLKNESPSLLVHGVIGFIDLLTVIVSSIPFVAIIRISDGSFTNAQTTLAAALLTGMIAFFYLALTQCVSGRTFGMMLTNTRVVDAGTFQPLSGSRSLIRTAGYFVSAAPALLGFFWSALNRKHRGWHDFISGSVVVRDF